VTTPSGSVIDLPALEAYRRELTGYCYRMLGSGFEADDAVQETLLRAWKGVEGFEGRASLRSWLYRIATNVCLDMLRGRERRARPMDLGPASTTEGAVLAPPLTERAWVLPIADARVVPADGDPAEIVAARESIRLAFVAALQLLPPRQRAVLVLREVLAWPAADVAELLGTSVASVNSALQRARATLAGTRPTEGGAGVPAGVPEGQEELLERFVEAFERYDVEGLVALLHDDAVQSMPPYELWLRGRHEIGAWLLGPGIGCRGSRLLPVEANGRRAFAQYRPDPQGGHVPWAIVIPEVEDGRIVELQYFLSLLDVDLFASFDLPPRLDG
jgi:RNA polymerase sigma-70 factor (ECF subfamily)